MKNLLKKMVKDLFPVPKLSCFDWDEDLQQRRARMDVKRKKCIEEMGDKWVLHESHKKARLKTPRPV